MTYEETIHYLYQQLPVFHRIGKKAFKANLDNTNAICAHLGNPHEKFKTIHIAGTNGKGSTSHFIAAILQVAGYKTGLYTSPHLKSYTERIRINGAPIAEEEVVSFVAENQRFLEDLKPSFFEMSVGMAFDYFARQQVDIAVIEVGLGGRLDSTNIIHPELSVITNISFDHTDILGDTLALIAGEKAGIIKRNTPVVISEYQDETKGVFNQKALAEGADIFFAEDSFSIKSFDNNGLSLTLEILNKKTNLSETYISQLKGSYQLKNILGVLQAVEILKQQGFDISNEDVKYGIENVVSITGLKGRWQVLAENPTMICDTAHNLSGITEVLSSIAKIKYNKLWMILGFVSDKDIEGILALLPKEATYIFCQANVPRALEANLLSEKAMHYNLHGSVIEDVNKAIAFVKNQASAKDLIYVGGSTFVVADIDEL
ncbi:folylpolyglutamate synthase/dihydrofolate synthase family protein [Arcicella aquatica]|uniref:Dihydrofolate synthase/folylpolyglutamate synthase n=1 Tax=Arcicella aquatica TaxID=217141 RepID=A0ABU5QKH0_9BACT|nr:folylpolyglutamate synthase/dihydrofolate synthase family protein [Arcicella aquatica]MEA5257339.1 folylpolyglutamate synthase/dihydrofolate synthase family protein [Arcicella aquatica]